jgi:glyoxylase-like metal-dependent hydrolase (beta-lactamase superfamily II)
MKCPIVPRIPTGVAATLLISGVLAAGVAVAADKQVSPVIKINEAARTTPITTTPLRGPLTMLSGSGGNITVLTGKQGKFMVDAGIAVSRPRLEKALQDLGNLPAKYVVNTHYHWDHTDGNSWLHDEGATIVGTEGTVKRSLGCDPRGFLGHDLSTFIQGRHSDRGVARGQDVSF